MEAVDAQHLGSDYDLHLNGIDELKIKHDFTFIGKPVILVFQVHLQVAPGDFVRMYNIAQLLAAPMIAISAKLAHCFWVKGFGNEIKNCIVSTITRYKKCA